MAPCWALPPVRTWRESRSCDQACRCRGHAAETALAFWHQPGFQRVLFWALCSPDKVLVPTVSGRAPASVIRATSASMERWCPCI